MARNMDFLSLVGRLGERRHPEDQLSNAFAACFNESAAFRHATVRLILTRHGRPIFDQAGARYEELRTGASRRSTV
jgi:hypothetical protein